MVVPGGGTPGVLESGSEPLALIRAFMALPKPKDGRFRTLLSVCTGSLFLASQGALKGLTAVTHPNFMGKLQMCNEQGEGAECTKVVDERYVVSRVNQNGLRVVTSGASGRADGKGASWAPYSVCLEKRSGGRRVMSKESDMLLYDSI